MKRRNQRLVNIVLAIIASTIFCYVGPLSAQMSDWFGNSKIHLIVIVTLTVSSPMSLLSKLSMASLLGSSSLLLTTAVGDNGTIVDGGIFGDWLLYQVLPVYAQYAEGLTKFYVGCLSAMLISILMLLGNDNG